MPGILILKGEQGFKQLLITCVHKLCKKTSEKILNGAIHNIYLFHQARDKRLATE